MHRRGPRPLRFHCPCCGQGMALHAEDSLACISSGSSTESFGAGHSDTESDSCSDHHAGVLAPLVSIQDLTSAEDGGLDIAEDIVEHW